MGKMMRHAFPARHSDVWPNATQRFEPGRPAARTHKKGRHAKDVAALPKKLESVLSR